MIRLFLGFFETVNLVEFGVFQTVDLSGLETLFDDFQVAFMSLDVIYCLVNVFLMSKIAAVGESKNFEIFLVLIISITAQIGDFGIDDNSFVLNLI